MEDQLEKNPQLRANELEERLIDFAVRIVRLSANLPRTAAGKHIAGQIMRSGTSPAPNYGKREERKALLILFTNSLSFLKS